jgi:hypothetical protein
MKFLAMCRSRFAAWIYSIYKGDVSSKPTRPRCAQLLTAIYANPVKVKRQTRRFRFVEDPK